MHAEKKRPLLMKKLLDPYLWRRKLKMEPLPRHSWAQRRACLLACPLAGRRMQGAEEVEVEAAARGERTTVRRRSSGSVVRLRWWRFAAQWE